MINLDQCLEILGAPRVIGYRLSCYNEWCSGPEHWGWSDSKPTTPANCPTCGWLALDNDGITPVEQES